MQLSKKNLRHLVKKPGLEIPDGKLFELPEKVLQFGTGVLLRALPDYFIDKANKHGVFNGRVVVVKSTPGDSNAFERQDGLYTVCIRGVEKGKTIEENIINASISRMLTAQTDWKKILACAHNPEMKIIFSNTTEVGIQLVQDDITAEPPVSFPGKLLAFLFERFTAFHGSNESGMVIVPTELITDNGAKLESILLELAHRNDLSYQFIEWLENHNTFCNSLVDRIVPGKPDTRITKKIEAWLGYHDELMTMSEVFRLWAIEGDVKVKEVLSFSKVDEGIIISPDITLFKELKLRLLNGTHTFNCGTAFLCGFNITREAMLDQAYGTFTRQLMFTEIVPAIPLEVDKKVKEDFASSVFERFCNPFIDHHWQSIAVEYTAKMKMRNVPLLLRYFELHNKVPVHMATAFAAYLLYMRAVNKDDQNYFGERNGKPYEIKDSWAEFFYREWQNNNPDKVVEIVMQNEELWETDLTKLPGLLQIVQEQLDYFIRRGVLNTIKELEIKRVTA